MQNTAHAIKAQNKPSSRDLSAAGLRAVLKQPRPRGGG
jgi:hypothetical protein